MQARGGHAAAGRQPAAGSLARQPRRRQAGTKKDTHHAAVASTCVGRCAQTGGATLAHGQAGGSAAPAAATRRGARGGPAVATAVDAMAAAVRPTPTGYHAAGRFAAPVRGTAAQRRHQPSPAGGAGLVPPGQDAPGGAGRSPAPAHGRPYAARCPRPPAAGADGVDGALAVLLHDQLVRLSAQYWTAIQASYQEQALETVLAHHPVYFEKGSAPLQRGPTLPLHIRWNALPDGSQQLVAGVDDSDEPLLLRGAGLWYVLPSRQIYGRVDGDPQLLDGIELAPPVQPEHVDALREELQQRDVALPIPLPEPRGARASGRCRTDAGPARAEDRAWRARSHRQAQTHRARLRAAGL